MRRSSKFSDAPRGTNFLRLTRTTVVVWLCLALPALAAPPREAFAPPAPATKEALKGLIPNVTVKDQHGQTIHFYRDLVRGRVFVINFVFTSCERLCPAQARLFAKLYQRLGDKVMLVSVSIDPATDTPERLKRWQEGFGGAPGWKLVTGTREAIDQIVMALTGDVARPDGHTPIVIIGNDSTGAWLRANGLGGVEPLMQRVQEVRQ